MTARPTKPVFVLGGHQTDFARNITREGLAIADVMREAILGALAASNVEPGDIEAGHVGNFLSESYCGQSHLGGLFIEADPVFEGIPVSRHEAACASGSMAVLAAMAEIEAGRCDVACIVGAEIMRTVSGVEAAAKLRAAAWVPRETEGVTHPWPSLFSDLAGAYDERYGLSRAHLGTLAKSNFDNAKRNPNAQTRRWEHGPAAFTADDDANPIVAGHTRKQDCSQVTDGAVAVVLASEAYVRRRDFARSRIARIEGWGHRTGRMAMGVKLRASAAAGDPFVCPNVRRTIVDAFERAGITRASDLHAIECHDCFSVSHYMAIDHFGITPPGQSFRAIEDGTVFFGGSLPMNPSGGLMGVGHPVGASGVRMLLDATKQVTGTAGTYQVDRARRVATLNIGGSATTVASFIVGRGAL